MKRLGIIGGIGPLASALFYEKLVLMCYENRDEVPDLLLVNFPFVRGFQSNRFEEGNTNETFLREGFFHSVDILMKNEIKYAVMVCNSLHLYLSQLPSTAPYFFHVPELVMQEAFERGFRSVFVLGSRLTRDSQLYHHPEISAHYLSDDDQQIVEKIIFNVLQGDILQEDSRILSEVIANCAKHVKFDAVALACTDLPILHNKFPLQTDLPLLDSIEIPAKRISLLL